MGADLVGKVEQGIPEDDPRNAAVIADNVGDNVGNCAGMAADLFEPYAVTLVASLVLGRAAFGTEGLVLPLLVPMIGAVTAVIGIMVVTPRLGDRSALNAINQGFFVSAVVPAALVLAAAFAYLPGRFDQLSHVSVAGEGGRRPTARGERGGGARAGAGRRHPAADRLLHRDWAAPGAGHQ